MTKIIIFTILLNLTALAVAEEELKACLLAVSPDGKDLLFRYENKTDKTVSVYPPGGAEAPITVLGKNGTQIDRRPEADTPIELKKGEVKVWRLPMADVAVLMKLVQGSVVTVKWHPSGLTSEPLYLSSETDDSK
jgi:hypothetical protein